MVFEYLVKKRLFGISAELKYPTSDFALAQDAQKDDRSLATIGNPAIYGARPSSATANIMKIAYVTTYDASDIKNWSGLGYFILKALEQQSIEIIQIGSLQTYTNNLMKAKSYFYKYITCKNYHIDREPRVLHSYAAQVARRLKSHNVDAVFSPGTIPICYLECSKPIVFWTDATYAGMTNFYPAWSNLCGESVRHGNRMEQAALTRCRLAIYTSDWAAKTAQDNYSVDASKVKVVPFGANIERERKVDDIKRIIAKRPKDICKLLFIGVDWYRKGGDIAVEIAESLNQEGLRTELTIVGCHPPGSGPEFVNVKGYVSKNSKEGQSVLDDLLEQSHFLLLPSRADCVPVVIPEANSFGMPVVTSNVGGIPTVVRPGVNGAMLRLENFVQEACNFIRNTMKDSDLYNRVAIDSFGQYENKLNWKVAGSRIKELLEEMRV
jgi:glycosyltransferase involved in cell wall biosynthesis